MNLPRGLSWSSASPSARRYHSILWSGSALLVWGGSGSAQNDVTLGDGAAYDPGAGTLARARFGGRSGPVSAWTGSVMVVWGGIGAGTAEASVLSGVTFTPATP